MYKPYIAKEYRLDECNHIELQCEGVDCPKCVIIGVPEEWTGTKQIYEGFYCNDKECQNQMKWIEDQCSGCVSGFPECSLGNSFCYGKATITEEDLDAIEKGFCPFRCNGTRFFDPESGKLVPINLSKKSSTESGRSFADKIRRYIRRFHDYGTHSYPYRITITKEPFSIISVELSDEDSYPEEWWKIEKGKSCLERESLITPRLLDSDIGIEVWVVWAITEEFAVDKIKIAKGVQDESE